MKMRSKGKIDQQPKQRKHIPQRTCVACRGIKAKKDLIRLVNTAGSIEIDLTNRKSGRGAYLCPNPNCWQIGLKGNRLEYTLRTKLTPEDRQSLLEYSRSLCQG